MVRIVVDHHLVLVPQPVVAVAIVIGCNTKIETAKPKTVPAPSAQAPDVFGAKAACEVPMLPRMVEVVVDISTAGIMPDPLAIGVDMRSVGMSFRVPVVTGLGGGVWRVLNLSWTVRRYIRFSLLAVFFALILRVLGKCRD
jgi:hypothetical protein